MLHSCDISALLTSFSLSFIKHVLWNTHTSLQTTFINQKDDDARQDGGTAHVPETAFRNDGMKSAVCIQCAKGRVVRGSFTLTLSQNRAWKSPLTRLFTLYALCICFFHHILPRDLLSSHWQLRLHRIWKVATPLYTDVRLVAHGPVPCPALGEPMCPPILLSGLVMLSEALAMNYQNSIVFISFC